jgi:hypothetical protein
VTHACNPSYSGGRDQENQSLRLARGKQTLFRKYPIQKRAIGVAPVECLPSEHEVVS